MKSSAASDGIGADEGDIRHLFSYNVQRLAALSTRIASLSIRPTFNISMHEWRAMAMLDYLGMAPLQTLAGRAGIQKSQMSRTVTALEAAGMIEREENTRDKRSTWLRLSPEGKALVREVLLASRDRNRNMLRALSEQERLELMRLMEKVTRGSLTYMRELKGETETPAPPEPESLFETEMR